MPRLDIRTRLVARWRAVAQPNHHPRTPSLRMTSAARSWPTTCTTDGMANTPDNRGTNKDRPTTTRPDTQQPDENRPLRAPGQGKDVERAPGRSNDDSDAT